VIAHAISRVNSEGLPITPEIFERLAALAKRALVPEHIEQRITPGQ
jgi:hypothetical protein